MEQGTAPWHSASSSCRCAWRRRRRRRGAAAAGQGHQQSLSHDSAVLSPSPHHATTCGHNQTDRQQDASISATEMGGPSGGGPFQRHQRDDATPSYSTLHVISLVARTCLIYRTCHLFGCVLLHQRDDATPFYSTYTSSLWSIVYSTYTSSLWSTVYSTYTSSLWLRGRVPDERWLPAGAGLA